MSLCLSFVYCKLLLLELQFAIQREEYGLVLIAILYKHQWGRSLMHCSVKVDFHVLLFKVLYQCSGSIKALVYREIHTDCIQKLSLKTTCQVLCEFVMSQPSSQQTLVYLSVYLQFARFLSSQSGNMSILHYIE